MGPPCRVSLTPGRKPQKIDTGKNEYLYSISAALSLSLSFIRFSSFTPRAESAGWCMSYGMDMYIYTRVPLDTGGGAIRPAHHFLQSSPRQEGENKEKKEEEKRSIYNRGHMAFHHSLHLLIVYPAIHFSFLFFC
jgi:hypothetical protein